MNDLIKTRKGIFIPDITVEMFRNASLEAVEELLVSGEMQDIILPSAEPEGKWTTEEVAELLFNLFGDECACNYNGIDEWLPERCKYTEIADECPNPKEKHGCWMQFLLQGGADMRGEKEETE